MLKRGHNRIHIREILFNLFHQKKLLLIILISFFVGIVVGIVYSLFFSVSPELVCGDGTNYGECSDMQPYYCEEGKLVEKASACGCVDGLTVQGDSCFSKYQNNPENITLNYTLRGEKEEIDFEVYGGMNFYLSRFSRSIAVENGVNPSKEDFKLKKINEEEQKNLLLPLVTKIQNLDVSEKDKLRIAVSLVQEISFGNSDKIVGVAGILLNYSRYPYEVLSELEGVCGEKSELLVFILREMGYGVGFFYYPAENHEAVAVKCPKLHSVGRTGYCLIETTGPSIITDQEIEYIGVGKLKSKPEVIVVSEGKSIGYWWYEYWDANRLGRLKNGWALFRETGLEKFGEKYNLAEVYNPN